MKVRIVYIILLLIFSLCSLTSLAQLATTIERFEGLLDSTENTGSSQPVED